MNNNVDWFPTVGWISCLRGGNKIWLVKEDMEATISYNYAYGSGQICLTKSDTSASEFWHVDCNGNGIDGKPLIRPIKGKCSSEPITISENKLNEIEKNLEMQNAYINSLERRISILLSGSMYEEFQQFLRLKKNGDFLYLEDEDEE